MNKNLLQIFLFALFLFSQSVVKSQIISIPYFCGFEDSTENAEWNMNLGPDALQCNDQWMISNIDYSEGSSALTISCDGGQRATFGSIRDLMVAYRKLKVDTAITINLSFDWKCEGIMDVSQLNFYFLPAGAIRDESELYSLNNSADLPRILSRPMATFSGSSDWVNSIAVEQLSLKPSEEYYMIFVWQNANTDTAQSVLSKYSVTVDNIQITSSSCPEPENLRYKSGCDTLFIDWDGYTELYEFQYKASGDTEWKTLPKTKEKKVVLVGVLEGAYDVRVRGLNETTNDKSAWRQMNEVICFCPDRHCINYVDLDRPGVQCLYGNANNPDDIYLEPTNSGNYGAGPIDKGSRDVRSRHTVNWRQNEYDPRTGNKLRTIPEGSLASVRLGNWNSGAQAEGIVFDYTVDTAQADIILMKYAVVLENPGHGREKDPYFSLEILDSNYVTIGGICGDFDFTPGNKNIKWEKHGGFVWKDWTAIGLNVSQFDGQNIKIRLITQDCVPTAHSGYAYFTLDCADASIKSTSCGETIEMKMEAPDGFRYTWTRGEEREFVANTKSINIPADDVVTYYCNVEYVDVDGCGFELHTEVKPRFPFADFVVEHKPENCENKVILKNTSCVHTRIDGVDTPTSEKCETFYWKIDDGGEIYEYVSEYVEIKSPKDGDTLKVSLVSYLSGGACEDDTTMIVVIPAIYEHYDTIYETICEGGAFQFENNVYVESGVYTATLTNCWGCDSVRTLFLTVVSQPDTVFLCDTICRGEVYRFRDKELTVEGEHKFMYKNDIGCDSVFVVSLSVVEPLVGSVSPEDYFVCADYDSLCVNFEIEEGLRLPTEYSLYFSDFAKSMGFVDVVKADFDNDKKSICFDIPKDCRPNSYNVTISFIDTTAICGDVSMEVDFDIYYPSSILEAKFGNLITIYDSAYNGGYTFVDNEYRWYKNNILIPAETSSFIYLEEGNEFNGIDCYYLELKRKDDGVVMRTCEICPDKVTGVDDIFEGEELFNVTVFMSGSMMQISDFGGGVVKIYSSVGQLVESYAVDSGSIVEIEVPREDGFYLVQIIGPTVNEVYKIWVK